MTQFKIGSVYRDVTNSVVRLTEPSHGDYARGEIWMDGKGCWKSYAAKFSLADGRYIGDFAPMDLTPGELHQFNGEWLPAEEERMAPYFAEALEESPDEPWIESWELLDIANAAMTARDGPSRPAAPVVIQEPAKTSHSPIAGLTVVAAVDHRLGSAFR